LNTKIISLRITQFILFPLEMHFDVISQGSAAGMNAQGADVRMDYKRKTAVVNVITPEPSRKQISVCSVVR